MLKVDLMTITTGPISYTVRVKHMRRPDEIAGILSFKVEVEQLQKLTLSLNSLNCKFLSNVEKGMYITFRIITYEDSLSSEKSKSIIGEFKPGELYQTKYKWDSLTEDDEDLSIELITSIESLKSSSLQVCVWNDKSLKKYDDIAEMRYKRFLNSDCEDHGDDQDTSKATSLIQKERFKASKEVKSFKYDSAVAVEDIRDTPSPKKLSIRSKSSSRLLDEPMIENAINRLLKKKIKRRGNMENLEGECYISFQKLLSTEFRNMDRKDYNKFEVAMRKSTSTSEFKLGKSTPQVNKRKTQSEVNHNKKFFKEILWLFGKKVGQTKGIFKVKLGKSIHQMGVGVMTENGISFSTSLILGIPKPLKNKELGGYFMKGKELGKLPDRLKGLSKLVKELYDLEKTNSKRSITIIQKREDLLKDIIEELSKNVGSKKDIIYNDELSLIRSQDLFLVFFLH